MILTLKSYYSPSLKSFQLGVTSVRKSQQEEEGRDFFKEPFQILHECGSYVNQHQTNFVFFS